MEQQPLKTGDTNGNSPNRKFRLIFQKIVKKTKNICETE
jgi:hypothetical protein